MGFAEIPIYHFITTPLVICSAVLYIFLIIKIVRRRRSGSSLFQTPFFTLVLGQAFWDLNMFWVAFFLVFCRRYYLIPFAVQENTFFAKLLYFLQTIFTNCMYMSSLLYALARFTAFKWPGKQDTLWRTRNIILLMILIFIIAVINVSRLFIGVHYVSLRMIAPGRMKMFQDDDLITNDSYQDLALSAGCCIICCIIYSWAAWKSKKLGFKGNMKYQRKFLICAITVYLPYIPNAVKSYLLIYAAATNNDILTSYCIEAWLFVTYLMCLVQPWVLLFTYPKIRPSLHSMQSSNASLNPDRVSSRFRRTHTEVAPIEG